MRYLHAFTMVLALSSCMPAEDSSDFVNAQSSLGATAVVVPPGPVAIPQLPSVFSALTAHQILCDSYKVTAADDDDADHRGHAGSIAAQCTETANEFYKELQVQLVLLTGDSTRSRGLAAYDARTTFLLPDGSYAQGAGALNAALPAFFDSHPPVSIQNKFIYKPLNKDTVILIGDPTYTLNNGAHLDSVQLQVYSRKSGGAGHCRALTNLGGRVCWSAVAEEFSYQQPFTGNSLPHPVSSVRAQIPSAPTYPAVLESARILCDGSFRSRHGDQLNCEQITREFYKELQFQILTLTNPDTVTSGLATLDEATTFVYPTGLVTEGVTALGMYGPSLFGINSAPIGIENKFFYKAIDAETVLFIGDPNFTMLNFVTGQPRAVESVQLSVYRRNATPLGSCRSAQNPNGTVCWTELAEQWVYGQPLRGN